MTQLTFVPMAPAATLSFGLDGQPPPTEIGGEAHIGWGIRVASDDRVELTTGGKLKDIRGGMSCKVGSASPLGKIQSTDHREIWGVLSYSEPRSEIEFQISARYFVQLFVSQRLFDQLLHLAELGRPPSVTVSFPRGRMLGGEETKADLAIRSGYGIGDYKWDNKTYPEVEIAWCSFAAHLGSARAVEDDDDEWKFEQLLPPSRADLAAIQERVAKIDDRVASFGKTVITVLWIIGGVYIVGSLITWVGGRF